MLAEQCSVCRTILFTLMLGGLFEEGGGRGVMFSYWMFHKLNDSRLNVKRGYKRYLWMSKQLLLYRLKHRLTRHLQHQFLHWGSFLAGCDGGQWWWKESVGRGKCWCFVSGSGQVSRGWCWLVLGTKEMNQGSVSPVIIIASGCFVIIYHFLVIIIPLAASNPG